MKTNMIGKSGAAMARMVGGMKNSAANAKQDGRVSEAESRIRTLTHEIGNLTVLMLDSKKNVGPEIKERYAAILEARKAIAAAEAEKIVTRAVCPHCGKKTVAGMRYCGHCGAELAPVIGEEIPAELNSTPFVRQYGILETSGVLFYAKRNTE